MNSNLTTQQIAAFKAWDTIREAAKRTEAAQSVGYQAGACGGSGPMRRIGLGTLGTLRKA
jgi:hypothetical protein